MEEKKYYTIIVHHHPLNCMKKKSLIIPILFVVFILGACKKDKLPLNEEELVTTVAMVFTETGTTTQTNVIFRDLDGEGGMAPSVFDSIILAPGKTYQVSVLLLNESAVPVDTISNEIEAEAVDHQFYYQPAGVAITVSNLNTDPVGLPLGTTSAWTTGVAGAGKIKVTLKHKPGLKSAGDPVTVGDTDVELDWPLAIR